MPLWLRSLDILTSSGDTLLDQDSPMPDCMLISLPVSGKQPLVSPWLPRRRFVWVNKYAWGRSTTQAPQRVDMLAYPIVSRDSVLDVAPGIVVGRTEKYRGQHVELWVQVPVGKSIRFTESALKNHSWLYDADSLYIMGVDGDLYRDRDKAAR